MFVDFFFHLRAWGVPVSPTEFLALLEALSRGLVGPSLDRFYAVSRALMVKRVEHFDLFDQAFASFFGRAHLHAPYRPAEIEDRVWQWLQHAPLRELTEAERAALEGMEPLDLDELRRQFEERLAEQEERHQGGSHWVGSGGTSPFGHSGANPGGIRVGGEGRGSTAVQVATKRRFRNLRNDLTLDVRQIGVALRRLRELTREGLEEELDLDATISATARNAGDLEIVFRPPRANRVKLMLLMDVGGSMTPYARLCEQLFSAAHQASHFKAFRHYYFHNCVYEELFTDIARRQGTSTQEILDDLDRGWRVVIVGDAAMAPSELMTSGGSIDYWHVNSRAGIYWLRQIRERVPASIWLNPDPPRYWNSYTTRAIGELFPMFPLTLEGLGEGVAQLRRVRR